ncbi:MAG: plastocyanin, partial [Zoogloeaceae bacterium]|nr:plastocyanin [Zoogloeaceae bacterium]
YMAHVPPGETGEIIWHFNQPGDFDFACLLPGHFEAGMVGKIKVVSGER